MRKMAASSSCPPRRSRTSSAASSVRRSGVRGRISASSSPTSAEALATSRMRSMSRCARGALRRCTENACASTARVKRHSSVTVCATRSASISSRGSIRTARLPRARSSASPIRARMPRTAIRSSPRLWARSRRSIPATISRATLTPCTQTAPPRARCAATACRRRRSRTTRTSTSARRPLAWSRSNTA